MRIAAFIIGLMGCSSLFFVGTLGALLGAMGDNDELVVVSYGIPLAALIGSCLALQYPKASAILLIGSAAAFFSIAGFGVLSLLVGGLTAVAGLFAVLGMTEARQNTVGDVDGNGFRPDERGRK